MSEDEMNRSDVNAGPRIDRLPVSGFHRRVLAAIGGGMFFDSFDVYLAGGVLGALLRSGWSDMQRNATFISVTFIGMIIGSFAAGFMGDRFGRRFNFQFNLALFGIASLAGSLAPSMTWLIVCRFFMGIGLAAEIVVGYAMLTEFTPPAWRGRWGALLSLITNTAVFVSTMTGFFVLPTLGWRWMFVIVAVGALIAWFYQRRLPESPRWLESRGRLDDAERALTAIEAEVSRSAGPLPAPGSAVPAAPAAGGGSVWALFRPEVIRRTLIGMLTNIVINCIIYGFVVWVPSFLIRQNGLTIASSLGYTSLMSLGGPCGAFVGFLMADSIGRRRGIVIVSIVAAALGSAYAMSANLWLITALGFGIFTCIYILVAFIFAVYVPELFPTEYRLRGTGVCTTVGRIASAFVPYGVVALFNLGGTPFVLALLAGLLALQAVVVGLWGVETRNRSLEALDPERAKLGPAAS
jgi:putative MFS transporter